MSMKRSLSPDSKMINSRPFHKQKSISDIIGPMITDMDLAEGTLASMAEANNTGVYKKLQCSGSTASSTQNSSQSSPDVLETSSDISWPGSLADAAAEGSVDEMPNTQRKISGTSGEISGIGTVVKLPPVAENGEISDSLEKLSGTNDAISGTIEELPDENGTISDTQDNLSAENEDLSSMCEQRTAENNGDLSATSEQKSAENEAAFSAEREKFSAEDEVLSDAIGESSAAMHVNEDQISATIGDISDLSTEQLPQDLDDMTDVDGRVTDAVCAVAKKGAKLTKKGAELVAEDIETVYRGTKFYAKQAAQDVVDCGVGLEDALGSVLNKTVNKIGSQHSVDESLGNNVHLMHPTYGASHMVPMGMHIQRVEFHHGSGYQIHSIEQDKLAQQASLKEDDVITAIDNTDVTDVSLEQILCIFGTISTTFSMTVVRRVTGDLDIPVLMKNIITVDVHIDDNEAVAIKVLDVRCTRLAFSGTSSCNQYIRHRHTPSNTLYTMRVANGILEMHPQTEETCEFKLNKYTPIVDDGCGNICSLSNVSSNKALAIAVQDGAQSVGVDETDGLTERNSIITVDFRFFHFHPQRNDSSGVEFAFQSSQETTNNLFLAFEPHNDSTQRLKLTPFSGDARDAPHNCRFQMVDAPSGH